LLLRPATVAARTEAICARTGTTRATLPAYIRDNALLATVPAEPEPELPEEPAAPATGAPYPFGLSQRQVEVLRLMAAGKRDRDIAEALVLSRNTVIRHVSNILDKTGCANRTEAAALAYRYRLMD